MPSDAGDEDGDSGGDGSAADAAAERAVEALEGATSDGGAPPSVDVYLGEYGEPHAEARAALYAALLRGLVRVAWEAGYARAEATNGDGEPPGAGPPFSAGPVSLDALAGSAPAMHDALQAAHERAGVFEDLSDHADCERYWDAVLLMNSHGIGPETAHASSVVCRECGGVVRGGLRNHLAKEHGGESAYRRKFPAAPVEPRERSLLPPARIDWSD